MTTELLDEGGPPLNLPSTLDVYQDLIRVRQQEGASISRIAKYGQKLQRLRISQRVPGSRVADSGDAACRHDYGA